MKAFKSGEKVPASGIYLTLHANPHAAPGRDMFFEGSRFPECGICHADVVYRLEAPCVTIPVPAMVQLSSVLC